MQVESYIQAKIQHRHHHHQCFNLAHIGMHVRCHVPGNESSKHSSLVPRFSFGNEASLVLGTYKIYREYRVQSCLDFGLAWRTAGVRQE